MAKASLAQIAHDPTTRLGRAVVLFEEHGEEIEQLAADIFAVPSSDGLSTYRVDYHNETCSCPDAEHHPDLNCKHVLCVASTTPRPSAVTTAKSVTQRASVSRLGRSKSPGAWAPGKAIGSAGAAPAPTA